MKNRIEIFILTYNRAEMLKDSIISLLNQSIGKIKITVLDNASTDNTENLVKELMAKMIICIILSKNVIRVVVAISQKLLN